LIMGGWIVCYCYLSLPLVFDVKFTISYILLLSTIIMGGLGGVNKPRNMFIFRRKKQGELMSLPVFKYYGSL